jgi:hypothetical protein
MKLVKLSGVFGAVVLVIFGSVLMATSDKSLAGGPFVPAANCVAPFLTQAVPMQWNESYVMNPTGNQDTWVVCPVPWDNATLPDDFPVFASGSLMSGASSELPSCFLSVTSYRNTTLRPYRTGNNLRFQKAMPTTILDANEGIWGATAFTSFNEFGPILGAGVTMNVFCKLPNGWSLTHLEAGD